MTGTDKTVQAAIQKQGLEKLKRIVKSLTRNGHVHTLLFHWFGNYTLQDLVVASSQLRTAATAALVKAQVQACCNAFALLFIQFSPAEHRCLSVYTSVPCHCALVSCHTCHAHVSPADICQQWLRCSCRRLGKGKCRCLYYMMSLMARVICWVSYLGIPFRTSSFSSNYFEQHEFWATLANAFFHRPGCIFMWQYPPSVPSVCRCPGDGSDQGCCRSSVAQAGHLRLAEGSRIPLQRLRVCSVGPKLDGASFATGQWRARNLRHG